MLSLVNFETSSAIPARNRSSISSTSSGSSCVPRSTSRHEISAQFADFYSVYAGSAYRFGRGQSSESVASSSSFIAERNGSSGSSESQVAIEMTRMSSTVRGGRSGGNYFQPYRTLRSHQSQNLGHIPSSSSTQNGTTTTIPATSPGESHFPSIRDSSATRYSDTTAISNTMFDHGSSPAESSTTLSGHTSTSDDHTEVVDDEDHDEWYLDDEDEHDGHTIEISSTRYTGSSYGSREFLGEWGGSTAAMGTEYTYERRGSPGTSNSDVGAEAINDLHYQGGNDRKDSVATLRRSSRSLNDDYASTSIHRHPASLSDDPLLFGPPSPISHPLSPTRKSATTSALPAADFDNDWSTMQGGITTLDVDFVRPPPEPHHSTARLNFFPRTWKSSKTPAANPNNDTFFNAVKGWSVGVYKEWTFTKELDPPPDKTAPPGSSSGAPSKIGGLWTMSSREKDTQVGLSSAGSSKTATSTTVIVPDPKSVKARLPNEVWSNYIFGRFHVYQTKATPKNTPNRAPQQRLVIIHVRDSSPILQHKSPVVSIHKHSKVAAFSITRTYKPVRSAAKNASTSLRPPAHDDARSKQTGYTSRNDRSTHHSSNTILLAGLRVQSEYTNTRTTTRLAMHGLLDALDAGGLGETASSSHPERVDRHRAVERRGQGVRPEGDAVGSTDVAPHQVASSGSSVSLYDGDNSDSFFVYSFAPDNAVRSVQPRDSIDSATDSTVPSTSKRSSTPHSKTYGTLDPSVIDQLRAQPAFQSQRQASEPPSTRSSLFQRMLSFRPTRSAPDDTLPHTPYDPRWLVLTSRSDQEQHRMISKDISSNFAGVGLLPTSRKPKSRHASSQNRAKSSPDHRTGLDDFNIDSLHSDSLFMVLPLWPGETDAQSLRKYRDERPNIPNEDRIYLLVYYQPMLTGSSAPSSSFKAKQTTSESKKLRSPTTSGGSAHKQDGHDRPNIFSTFRISARLVSYRELQGSGVRLPDEGLCVCGALKDAYATMPAIGVQDGRKDWVIGGVESKESGVIFDYEGLVKLSLCNFVGRSRSSSRPMNEEDDIPELKARLTPIGRAVMEMVWSGAMALVTFGS